MAIIIFSFSERTSFGYSYCYSAQRLQIYAVDYITCDGCFTSLNTTLFSLTFACSTEYTTVARYPKRIFFVEIMNHRRHRPSSVWRNSSRRSQRMSTILFLLTAIMVLLIFLSLSINIRLAKAVVSGTSTFSGVTSNEQKVLLPKTDAARSGFLKTSSTKYPATITSQIGNQKFNGKVVDILSVASNKRPEYMQTQRNTWANHPLVRNFFNVTEDLDGAGGSCQGIPRKKVLTVSKYCRRRYLSQNSSDGDFSWLMQRYTQYYARKVWLKTKPDPAGWLCAQKRFPIGLARAIQGYFQRGEALPDFLLVVDDDTYYNMDGYFKEIVSTIESSQPYVGAGCRVTNGRDMDSGIVFPFGGFGLSFSKGSLMRMLRPLSRDSPMENDKWQNATLAAIDENLIVEKETFRDGMNLAQMMEEFALAEPFHNMSRWTRGYCFHGHWILAIFTQLYGLHSTYYMDAVQGSEITLKNVQKGPQYSGLCRNEYSNCKFSDLACHYQNPADMQRLIGGAVESKSSGYDISAMDLRLANNDTEVTEPPMLILKSRFMQFQPSLLALGQARLKLFETFCLPTLLGQSDQNFIWIIRTDPELSEQLLQPLQALLSDYTDRIFLVGSNENTGGFRSLDVGNLAILSGSRKVLQRAVEASQRQWLVESRLDLDDGLHKKMIQEIRQEAMQYAQRTKDAGLFKGNQDWRAFCVSRSINWHSGALSPIKEINPNVTDTLNIPPEGIVTRNKKAYKSCITPGLSFVLPPHVGGPPIIGHHVLHEMVPRCNASHDLSGEKCLQYFDLDYDQAVQARTPTSAGMGGFHREYKPRRSESTKLWETLKSDFSISKSRTTSILRNLKENVVAIAKDNLLGQCTEDHSCSHFARRALERIIWFKELEQNSTTTVQ